MAEAPGSNLPCYGYCVFSSPEFNSPKPLYKYDWLASRVYVICLQLSQQFKINVLLTFKFSFLFLCLFIS